MTALYLFLIAASPFVLVHVRGTLHAARVERRKAIQAFYTQRKIAHRRACGSRQCPCQRISCSVAARRPR